jgi:hypothetical protein
MRWVVGSALVALAVGFLIGRFSAFELGIGVGLLIPGVVGLTFATRCLLEYRAFAAPVANNVTGEVVAIEDRAVNESGSITQPVPVIRFKARDRSIHTVRGPASGSFKPGEEVRVLYDPADPSRARVGKVSELRGGAIVFMLFGTFPFSLGLWFIHSFVQGLRRTVDLPVVRSPMRQRITTPLIVAFNVLLVAGILWTGLGPGEIEDKFTPGFGLVSLGLWGHGIRGLFDRGTNTSWSFGMLVLAINFTAWTVALWLLLGGSS